MKSGLVLEGGGTRGIYTAGILDVFLEYGIEFDGVIGVSAGRSMAFLLYQNKKEEASVIIRNIVMIRDLWEFKAGLRQEIL